MAQSKFARQHSATALPATMPSLMTSLMPSTCRQHTIAGTAIAAGVLLFLSACGGGGDDSPSRGSAASAPVQTASLTTTQIDAATTSSGFLPLAGPAKCAVSVSSVEYNTVGGKGEATNATTAVMVPSGATGCTGARPIVLYAHGTTLDRTANMANVAANGEAAMAMAAFAAQGFIVVAPNYTGYDKSTLPYHPYLNAEAQSNDMIDALRAAKAVMPGLSTTTTAGTQVFITGYSQGGYVAMATHRSIESNYSAEIKVAGSSPSSGPYSLLNFSKLIFSGTQNIGASQFTPLIVSSYQNSYGNVYTSPSDFYASPFDTILPNALPSNNYTAVVAQLPAGADGSYRTLFDAGNGTPFLVKTSAATAAQLPTSPYYLDTAKNDLLGWKPVAPVALCYGAQDPTVFGMNATQAAASFQDKGVTVARYDLEDATTVPAAIKQGFDATKAQISAAAGGGTAGAGAVTGKYHGTIVPPFCTVMARGFFQGILAASQ